MIRQLVPGWSGCWPGDILVILLLGETNLKRKLKIYGPKINSCRKAAGLALEELERSLGQLVSQPHLLALEREKNCW